MTTPDADPLVRAEQQLTPDLTLLRDALYRCIVTAVEQMPRYYGNYIHAQDFVDDALIYALDEAMRREPILRAEAAVLDELRAQRNRADAGVQEVRDLRASVKLATSVQSQKFDVLINAKDAAEVHLEAQRAALRQLQEYVQHKRDCSSWTCEGCGVGGVGIDGLNCGARQGSAPHKFKGFPCTCGLDALSVRLTRHQTDENEDSGA